MYLDLGRAYTHIRAGSLPGPGEGVHIRAGSVPGPGEGVGGYTHIRAGTNIHVQIGGRGGGGGRTWINRTSTNVEVQP